MARRPASHCWAGDGAALQQAPALPGAGCQCGSGGGLGPGRKCHHGAYRCEALSAAFDCMPCPTSTSAPLSSARHARDQTAYPSRVRVQAGVINAVQHAENIDVLHAPALLGEAALFQQDKPEAARHACTFRARVCIQLPTVPSFLAPALCPTGSQLPPPRVPNLPACPFPHFAGCTHAHGRSCCERLQPRLLIARGLGWGAGQLHAVGAARGGPAGAGVCLPPAAEGDAGRLRLPPGRPHPQSAPRQVVRALFPRPLGNISGSSCCISAPVEEQQEKQSSIAFPRAFGLLAVTLDFCFWVCQHLSWVCSQSGLQPESPLLPMLLSTARMACSDHGPDCEPCADTSHDGRHQKHFLHVGQAGGSACSASAA